MTVILGIVIAALAVIALTASRSIRIIREYQRVVLFRLGRAIGAKGPGLIFINPVTDRVSMVDLRELFLEIPHQTAITKDNASISIDFIMFYKVLDPVMSVVQVRDFSGAALNIASTTLRSVVGEMSLDDVLSKREDMNNALRTKLDDVTERWGVKVTNVEVREINPPPGVQDAMTRQMSAERTRRAVVTESEGQRQAAITVAEGQKQSAILAAEGERQAIILAAEGERQAAVLRAQGLAGALDAITSSAAGAGPNTMVLQYLDALRQMASAPSTKFVLPLELTNLIGGVRNLAEQFSASSAKVQDPVTANNRDGAEHNANMLPKAIPADEAAADRRSQDTP
ncbi:MAG: SPFH/Band 7/PHB domain protein [Actinomycetota bacterium]|nr:MAG: SPFH/Band 7/PHB domain protein [Actinomycetota bacterium]